MNDWPALLSALPSPPDYRYDWERLREIALFRSLAEKMEKTPQNLVWHGEGDVWTHTKMVCGALCGLADFRMLPEDGRNALALAALLHDVGKILCTRMLDGVPASPHHALIGAMFSRRLLWTEFGLCGEDKKMRFREAVCLLIAYHTQPVHLFEREEGQISALRIAADGELAPCFSLRSLCLLGEADELGRVCADQRARLDQVELTRELAREAGCFLSPYPFASARTARALFKGGSVWPDQEMFDPSWGEVILLCGLPGTGKDHWCQIHRPDLPTVSLDDWRRRLKLTSRDEQGRAVQAAREEAREYLRRKQPFIWNATCLTAMRGRQIDLFEDYGARSRIVYLETEWQENLRRNAARQAQVPESVIADMLSNLCPPRRFEAQAVEWQCV